MLACYKTFLSHIYRQGNAVAHILAQRVRLSSPLQFWIESVLLDLNAIVLANLKPFE